MSVNYHPSGGVISVLSINVNPCTGELFINMSVNYHPSGRVISVRSINLSSTGVISIKSKMCISSDLQFPSVASAPAEGITAHVLQTPNSHVKSSFKNCRGKKVFIKAFLYSNEGKSDTSHYK